jgi:multidrug resistance efflux pump
LTCFAHRPCKPRHESAAAAISLAANDLSYTVIRAPFEGIVGRRAAEPAQQVSLRNHVFAVPNFKETNSGASSLA